MRTTMAIAAVLLAATGAWAQGLVIPDEPDLPPLALKKHSVRVQIDHQTATTSIEQVFVNHTERRLEAQYVFPIPRGAAMSRFTMLVNGKEQSAELVEKAKARALYNSMVNRAKEPGLLEYLGSDLFRANIFPIEPHSSQTITVRYQQVLTAEDSMVRYLYPVRVGAKRGPTVHGEFDIEITIASPTPIQNIYSPSHAVLVTRANDRTARVNYGDKNVTLEKDFQVYYGLGDRDIGLNLVTYRPDPSQPGHFMMLLSPRSELQAKKLVERDLVFVIDNSGSMETEKMQQAKNALKYCITHLNDGDRFNIIRFSTDVYPWKDRLVPAKDGRAAAMAWIDAMTARGGTDIAGALDAALSLPRDPARPYFVIFMTDGKPTLGETIDPAKILAKIERAKTDNLRIFTWGVGYDVDTHLLDAIAERARGVSEYVHPEEDIAAKVASFYSKASHPMLTDLKLQMAGDRVQLLDVHPRMLPDLYAKTQMVVFGRYTGEGDIAFTLTGRVNDKSETFQYEARFPVTDSKASFIEPLWARRQVGHLLDAIRQHGEKPELVDEVVRLSKEYSIQTPYTSFLILEDGTPAALSKNAGPGGGAQALGLRGGDKAERKLDEIAKKPQTTPSEPSAAPPPAMQERERQEHNDMAKALDEGFKGKDGKSSVDTAGYLRRLKEAERASDGRSVPVFRRGAATRFFLYREFWVDERFDADTQVTRIKFGSDAYFRLIELKPGLVEALKIGTSLVYVTGKAKAIAVSDTGEERLSDEAIEALFK